MSKKKKTKGNKVADLIDRFVEGLINGKMNIAEGEWIIEGTGIDADIVVDNMPRSSYDGADAQLDAAIDYLMQKMEEEPVVMPEPPASKDLSFGERR